MPAISSYALQYSSVDFAAISASTFDLFITEGDADSSSFIVPSLSDAQVATLTGQGRTLVGYVNVAVTDANRAYWQDSWTSDGPYQRDNDDLNPVDASAPAWLQTQPTNGFGVIVDFTDSAWQGIVINQAVALVQRGYTGVFLDDVAQYYTLGAPGGEAGIRQMANLMCQFVADIAAAVRAVNANAYVVVNSDPYLHTNVTTDSAGAQASAAYLAAVDAHLLENKDAAALNHALATLSGETRLILESDGSPAYSYADSWARGILYTAPDQSYNSLGSFAYPATEGPDRLIGGDGPNQISGLGGNDILDGGAGVDTLSGNGGDDIYYVDSNDQVIEAAGGGSDTVKARATFVLGAGSSVELFQTSNHAGTNAINLSGNELDNKIIGNAGANVLKGNGGNDVLQGLGGADRFVFATAPGTGNVDRIVDFTPGVDQIALRQSAFAGLATGALSANAFFTGAAAHDADDRIIYNSATGALFFDADGNGAGAAVQFATVVAGLPIAASDFIVI
jgi:uncharacterized protein (TIGR01370 family)